MSKQLTFSAAAAVLAMAAFAIVAGFGDASTGRLGPIAGHAAPVEMMVTR